jgi:hypothetical protein
MLCSVTVQAMKDLCRGGRLRSPVTKVYIFDIVIRSLKIWNLLGDSMTS